MKHAKNSHFTPVNGLALYVTAFAGIAAAQTPDHESAAHRTDTPTIQQDVDEITVTARRRSERALDVPVVITAITGEQLSQQAVNSLPDIARIVPQLSIEQNGASFGGITTLRGITNPSSNASAEAAITVNVDGITLSNGAALRLAQFDIGQVEILEGPQALFFGKNSSGGIISLHSEEPTRDFTSRVSVGYEPYARQGMTTAMVSGPMAQNLLGRLAVEYTDESGYRINDAPDVTHRRGPGTEEWALRGSLLFEPSDNLKIALKTIYDDENDNGFTVLQERIFCPSGAPTGPAALPSITNCTAGQHSAIGDEPDGIAAIAGNPLYRDGVPYSTLKQGLASLNVDYSLTDRIGLNSLTGYYQQDQAYTDPSVRGPIPILNSVGSDNRWLASQELRLLSTDTAASFNWMVGLFYQDDHLFNTEQVVQYTPPSQFLVHQQSRWTINGRTESGFGQASWKFPGAVTLSAGARYTHEVKSQEVNLSDKFLPAIRFNNTSPEVTLSFQPQDDINTFVSYKQGYKSGNFQVTSLGFLGPIANPAVAAIDNSYKEERAEGFEGGLKSVLLNHQLDVDFAVYHYKYLNLQLSSFDPVQQVTRISNAASSIVEGAELSLNLRPATVPGLRLFESTAYNKAHYQDFVAACYVGQVLAAGCDIRGPGAVTPNFQSLSGNALPRAPLWSGNVGFDFTRPVGSSLQASLNAQGLYQTWSYLSQESAPWGIRHGQMLVDAGISIGSQNDSWQLSIVGKNLANEFYPVTGFQESLTGVAASTGTAVGHPADYTGLINRGREIWLRMTIRPDKF